MATLVLVLISGAALANVPAVTVTAPDNANTGEPVTIAINVDHRGASRGHYVDSVTLYDGDKMLQKWDYSPGDFIKDQVFGLEYKTSFTKDANLKAAANCNIHGPGSAMKTVTVK